MTTKLAGGGGLGLSGRATYKKNLIAASLRPTTFLALRANLHAPDPDSDPAGTLSGNVVLPPQ